MAAQVGQLAALFASPYAIKETLRSVHLKSSPVTNLKSARYIETGGKDATIKPWLWIICLFLAPISRALFSQGNVFLVTKAVARTEIIVSQLVFDHALRIRIKAETSDNMTPSKAVDSANPKSKTLHVKNANSNFLGRMNSLITTDVANISGCHDFLLIGGRALLVHFPPH